MTTKNNFPKIGERIIVQNIRYAISIVSEVVWSDSESRYVIRLYWQDADGYYIGKSFVYLDDENKIWFRESKNN